MFRRLLVEDWQNILSIISFSIFFCVFVLTVLRLWRAPRPWLEHMENLPLENENHESTRP